MVQKGLASNEAAVGQNIAKNFLLVLVSASPVHSPFELDITNWNLS